MANQSKILFLLQAIVSNVMLGNRKNKAISCSIVAIIGFLIYMRNHSKSPTENLRLAGSQNKVRQWVMFRREEGMWIRCS